MQGERKQRVLGAASPKVDVPSSPEENSSYKAGDDVFVLIDEVLNNSTRAVLVYDDFSGGFSDQDLCALAAVMRYNTSILSINLCGVDVGDSTVSLLADALVRSRVRVIDLSNTYLAEEAGAALVALANCNPNLRTVVVDETLIPEEIMDEIDMACQYNDTLGDPQDPVPIDPDRERFCARNCFGCCPDGDYCVLSHRAMDAIPGRPQDRRGNGRPLELPQAPTEGASWSAEGRAEFKPQLDRLKRRRRKKAAQASSRAWLWWAVPTAAVVVASVAVAGVVLVKVLR